MNAQKSYSLWLFAFMGLSFLNIIAELIDIKLLIYLTKPLLLTTLSIYFYLNCRNESRFAFFILGGFLFSIAGDTLLMFVEHELGGEQFFLFGLGSFLITHLLYIAGFGQIKGFKKGLLAQQKWIFIPGGLFLAGNLIYLWPDIPDAMKIAVGLYSFVIISMALSCFNLKSLITTPIFQLLMSGVLLFLLSDTIIGLNKFKSHQLSLPYPRLLIMLTYLSGQYLICKASILIHQNRLYV